MARKSPSVARAIKVRFGQAAYEAYKATGAIPSGFTGNTAGSHDPRVRGRSSPAAKKAAASIPSAPQPSVPPATPPPPHLERQVRHMMGDIDKVLAGGALSNTAASRILGTKRNIVKAAAQSLPPDKRAQLHLKLATYHQGPDAGGYAPSDGDKNLAAIASILPAKNTSSDSAGGGEPWRTPSGKMINLKALSDADFEKISKRASEIAHQPNEKDVEGRVNVAKERLRREDESLKKVGIDPHSHFTADARSVVASPRRILPNGKVEVLTEDDAITGRGRTLQMDVAEVKKLIKEEGKSQAARDANFKAATSKPKINAPKRASVSKDEAAKLFDFFDSSSGSDIVGWISDHVDPDNDVATMQKALDLFEMANTPQFADNEGAAQYVQRFEAINPKSGGVNYDHPPNVGGDMVLAMIQTKKLKPNAKIKKEKGPALSRAESSKAFFAQLKSKKQLSDTVKLKTGSSRSQIAKNVKDLAARLSDGDSATVQIGSNPDASVTIKKNSESANGFTISDLSNSKDRPLSTAVDWLEEFSKNPVGKTDTANSIGSKNYDTKTLQMNIDQLLAGGNKALPPGENFPSLFNSTNPENQRTGTNLGDINLLMKEGGSTSPEALAKKVKVPKHVLDGLRALSSADLIKIRQAAQQTAANKQVALRARVAALAILNAKIR